jgi:GST-like protein
LADAERHDGHHPARGARGAYAVTRFTDEVDRLYVVLDNRLYDRPGIAGDAYKIAEMICYPWTIT